jgi:hypothetical protein
MEANGDVTWFGIGYRRGWHGVRLGQVGPGKEFRGCRACTHGSARAPYDLKPPQPNRLFGSAYIVCV